MYCTSRGDAGHHPNDGVLPHGPVASAMNGILEIWEGRKGNRHRAHTLSKTATLLAVANHIGCGKKATAGLV